MSDFAAELVSFDVYHAHKNNRIESPANISDEELYLAMLLLREEVRGFHAAKVPARILKTERYSSRLFTAKLSLLDQDLQEQLRSDATFHEGFWANIGENRILINGVRCVSGYLKNGRSEIDDELQVICDTVGTRELVLA